MTVAELISEDIWEMLKQSLFLELRLGEETLTDILLLNLGRFSPPGIEAFQTPDSKNPNAGRIWKSS